MHRGWYDRSIRKARDLSNGDSRIYLEFEVRRLDCRSCGKVKRERLGFLADNTHYTERFAYYVGRRCASATVQDVAKELHLDWHARRVIAFSNVARSFFASRRRRLTSTSDKPAAAAGGDAGN